jgi:hypothetical protein
MDAIEVLSADEFGVPSTSSLESLQTVVSGSWLVLWTIAVGRWTLTIEQKAVK